MGGWPGVGAGHMCAQGGVRAGGCWGTSPTPAAPSQLQFWYAWGFLSAPRVVICQEHSLKAQRRGASPGDTASALPDSATPWLHCWVVLMEPLLARNRGRSAHLQRGCVPPPRPVAQGCCEEWLGGGLTGRSLSPPRALAPPAEAAAPPLTGCPPRPGGHTPSARGASWAWLGGPPPAPSALSGSPRRGSGWWAGRTSAGQTPRWPGWRRGDLPVRGPGGSAGLTLTGRVLCP